MKLILTIISLSLFIGCSELPTAEHVIDVRDKKETICGFVELWSEDFSELNKVKELCESEATLKEIAAAYAGCSPE